MSHGPPPRHPPPRAATSPRAGVEALFRSEYESMVRLAYSLLSSRSEAEDVVQDAFADLYRRWDEVLNPAGYVRVSVVHGARRQLRRRIQRDSIHQRIGTTTSPHHDDADEYLLDSVDRLPERYRTALILAYYADLGPNEIADAMTCRPGTAKSLVHRAVKKLRKELHR